VLGCPNLPLERITDADGAAGAAERAGGGGAGALFHATRGGGAFVSALAGAAPGAWVSGWRPPHAPPYIPGATRPRRSRVQQGRAGRRARTWRPAAQARTRCAGRRREAPAASA